MNSEQGATMDTNKRSMSEVNTSTSEVSSSSVSNYEELIDHIATNELPEKDYYQLIIKYRDDILLDIIKSSQAEVAKKLGLSQSKLSAISYILKYL